MKAFSVEPNPRVYIYSEAVSMCCHFRGLSKIVKEEMGKEPSSGDLFVFMNSKNTYMKVLFWSHDGLCIFSKVLPYGEFEFKGGVKQMNISEMNHLIDYVLTAKRMQEAA